MAKTAHPPLCLGSHRGLCAPRSPQGKDPHWLPPAANRRLRLGQARPAASRELHQAGRLGACRCLDPDLRLRGPRGRPGRGWSPQDPLCSCSPSLANKLRASHTLPSPGVSSRQLCPWALPTVQGAGLSLNPAPQALAGTPGRGGQSRQQGGPQGPSQTVGVSGTVGVAQGLGNTVTMISNSRV